MPNIGLITNTENGLSVRNKLNDVINYVNTGFTQDDKYVTGGTFSAGTLTLNRQNGDVTITGFTTNIPQTILRSTTDFSTSSTTYVILYSGLIPANTFAVGDTIHFEITYRKTGTAGTGNNRVYVNTSASLVGATQIAQKVMDSSANLYGKFERTPIIKSATNTEIIIATNNLNTDFTNVSNAASTLNINWAVDQYFIVGGSVSNAADTHILSGVILQKL